MNDQLDAAQDYFVKNAGMALLLEERARHARGPVPETCSPPHRLWLQRAAKLVSDEDCGRVFGDAT